MTDIALCTLYTPEIIDFAKYTTMNFRSYCNKHCYDYIESSTTLDPSRTPHWSKIKLLQLFIGKYRWLIWVDADAAITNKCIKIENIIDPYYDIIICKEDGIGKDIINTGVFIIKCSEWSKKFLQTWYDQDHINAIWWDQSAFINLYDNYPSIQSHIKIIRQKVMNCSPEIFSQGDFIIHYFGTHDRKPLKRMVYYKDPNYVPSRDKIPDILNMLGLFGYGIEVGVERGLYSEQILSRSNLSKLYLCDSWDHLNDYHDINNVDSNTHEQKYIETINRLSKFKDRAAILRMSSRNTVKLFNDDSLDFVYIDANHSYKYVLEDIKLWFPKVRKGGIIAGHDFLDGNRREGTFGVFQAVKEFFAYSQCIYITDEEWPSWYVFK